MGLVYGLTVLGFVLYALVVWLLSRLLGLVGGRLLFFIFSLILIGLAEGIVVILLVRKRRQKAAMSNASTDLEKEIVFLVKSANTKLSTGRQIREGASKLSDLHLVLFIGDSASSKTSVIINSGLQPELLAGQVYEADRVVSTRIANLWLAENTALAEVGFEVLRDPSAFKKLIRMLRGGRVVASLTAKTQSPRAVVLCCGADTFLQNDTSNDLSTMGRRFHGILEEISQDWGSRVPIYVLITKMDLIGSGQTSPTGEELPPYFNDYVRLFTPSEAVQAFGVTLPLGLQASAGAYNEQQNRYLSIAVESLFGTLADKRLEYLNRENDLTRIPNIYEFPREFRKIRDNLVGFLVDIGRPSQLRATPYLRGFYFTGVRPLVVNTRPDSIPIAPGVTPDALATMVFSRRSSGSQQPEVQRFAAPQRIADWVFLPQFLRQIVLGDASARLASAGNTRTALFRRWVYSSGAILGLIWALGSTTSYLNNRNMIRQITEISHSLTVSRGTDSTAQAEKILLLDSLTKRVAEVTENQRTHPRLGFRWGLYPGTALYNKTRTLYCREFEELILADTRNAIESYLRGLPNLPRPGDDYELPFRTLKAYLLMTSEGSRTDPEFLSKTLTDRWSIERSVPPRVLPAISNEFDFYARERAQDLCGSVNDAIVVAKARQYLLGFQPIDQVYESILEDVSRRGKPLQFEDPSKTVVDPLEVQFVYTKAAYLEMQKRIHDEPQYFDRDPWVLRENPSGNSGVTDLSLRLQQRYLAQYGDSWQKFLTSAIVPIFSNPADAARKLGVITSSQSPLLRLLCTVSINADVEAAQIKDTLRSTQSVEPAPTCSTRPIDAPVQQYVQELVKLQIQLDNISKQPDPANANYDSSAAKLAAATMSSSLNLTAPVPELLLQPINNADAVIKKEGPAAVNAKARETCQTSATVFNAFPFNRNSQRDVQIDDFKRVLRPGSGIIAQFLQKDMADLIIDDGTRLSAKSGAKIKLTPNFLEFANRASAVTKAFFPNNNDEQPRLNYFVRPWPSLNSGEFTLDLDGKSRLTANDTQPQDFTWVGEPGTVRLESRTGGASVTATGPWALFHFLAQANTIPTTDVFDYDVYTQIGRGNNPQAKPQQTIHLQFASKAVPGIFRQMFGLQCVSQAVTIP